MSRIFRISFPARWTQTVSIDFETMPTESTNLKAKNKNKNSSGIENIKLLGNHMCMDRNLNRPLQMVPYIVDT